MKLEDIGFIADQLYLKTRIPIMIVDQNKKTRFPKYPIDISEDELLSFCFETKEDTLHIINNFEIMVGSFKFYIENVPYYLFIGPCIVLSSKNAFFTYHDLTITIDRHLAKENEKTFIDHCKMVYWMIYQHMLDQNHIHIKYIKSKTTPTITHSIENNLFERRSQEATYDSYQFELRFIEYVKRGKKDKIEWIIHQINNTYQVDLSKNALLHLKYKITSLIAILTRATIEEGVPLDTAFSFSDTFIQELDNIYSIDEGIRFIKYFTFEFVDLIQSKNAGTFSSFIKQTIAYIDAHLYDKIILADIGISINKNTSYLSTRFKEEVGESIKDYILKRKIEEACQLLLFTDRTYQEISTLLNFTSQSHFIQRFKKVMILTPKEYREKHSEYA